MDSWFDGEKELLKQNDLFDISSGKIFKKWSKKPKGRKKLEEFLG